MISLHWRGQKRFTIKQRKYHRTFRTSELSAGYKVVSLLSYRCGMFLMWMEGWHRGLNQSPRELSQDPQNKSRGAVLGFNEGVGNMRQLSFIIVTDQWQLCVLLFLTFCILLSMAILLPLNHHIILVGLGVDTCVFSWRVFKMKGTILNDDTWGSAPQEPHPHMGGIWFKWQGSYTLMA